MTPTIDNLNIQNEINLKILVLKAVKFLIDYFLALVPLWISALIVFGLGSAGELKGLAFDTSASILIFFSPLFYLVYQLSTLAKGEKSLGQKITSLEISPKTKNWRQGAVLVLKRNFMILFFFGFFFLSIESLLLLYPAFYLLFAKSPADVLSNSEFVLKGSRKN